MDEGAEFPVTTWIRLTVDETTAVVYVQRTRLPSEGQSFGRVTRSP